MTVSGTLTLTASINDTEGSQPSGVTTVSTISVSQIAQITAGTGANQANEAVALEYTISDSSNQDIDLAGSVSDAFGNTVTFTNIKGVIIVADSGNAGDVTIDTSNPTNPMTTLLNGIVTLAPGAWVASFDPSADGAVVTAGSADVLRIANSSGDSATVTVYLFGDNA